MKGLLIDNSQSLLTSLTCLTLGGGSIDLFLCLKVMMNPKLGIPIDRLEALQHKSLRLGTLSEVGTSSKLFFSVSVNYVQN
jgi:hypothetical protein